MAPLVRSNPSPADPSRQLMIKVKTCQRLLKEADHYKKELVSNQSHMGDITAAAGTDIYDIKLFQQVLDESRMMVPDSEKRLAAALEELQDFVSENAALEGEWMQAAKSVLTEQDKQGEAVDVVPETTVVDLAEGEAF